MIIKSVFIEKFGGLTDKYFEFSDGLNVITLPNEGGKSTVAEFIRVMLFGVNSLRFNQRKKYMPFDSTVMGGEICVEADGEEYIIKRSFGSRKSDDKISVVNKSSGIFKKELAADDVGSLLLGINGDTFDNTCYIKQLCCAVNDDKTSEIQLKLINLSQGSGEDYSYKKAVSILDSAARELTGSKGKMRRVKDKLNEIAVLKSEKKSLENEIEVCKNELHKTVSQKPAESLSLRKSAVAFVAAAFFAALSLFVKPMFTLPFCALFVFVGTVLLLNGRKNSALLIENAKKTGFYESRLQSLTEKFNSIDVSEYEFYVSELERLNSALSDIEYARNCLSEAFFELQKDYAPRLNKTACEIFSKITGGKYIEFLADDSYGVSVRDAKNRLFESEYVSCGTFDQIYFSLRIALAKLIAPGVPMVLDDSFALYDDERLKSSLSCLKSLDRQVLLFTCHGRESALF